MGGRGGSKTWQVFNWGTERRKKENVLRGGGQGCCTYPIPLGGWAENDERKRLFSCVRKQDPAAAYKEKKLAKAVACASEKRGLTGKLSVKEQNLMERYTGAGVTMSPDTWKNTRIKLYKRATT